MYIIYFCVFLILVSAGLILTKSTRPTIHFRIRECLRVNDYEGAFSLCLDGLVAIPWDFLVKPHLHRFALASIASRNTLIDYASGIYQIKLSQGEQPIESFELLTQIIAKQNLISNQMLSGIELGIDEKQWLDLELLRIEYIVQTRQSRL